MSPNIPHLLCIIAHEGDFAAFSTLPALPKLASGGSTKNQSFTTARLVHIGKRRSWMSGRVTHRIN
jgi:hypothetical protein